MEKDAVQQLSPLLPGEQLGVLGLLVQQHVPQQVRDLHPVNEAVEAFDQVAVPPHDRGVGLLEAVEEGHAGAEGLVAAAPLLGADSGKFNVGGVLFLLSTG